MTLIINYIILCIMQLLEKILVLEMENVEFNENDNMIVRSKFNVKQNSIYTIYHIYNLYLKVDIPDLN